MQLNWKSCKLHRQPPEKHLIMKLSGLHLLLTYRCTYECEHCFVWGSPNQSAVFSFRQLAEVLQQAADCDVQQIYFEGGEAFLYYPLLLAGVRQARELELSTGIVSNAYWATGPTEARLWLAPLAEAGLDVIEFSSDLFHGQTMLLPEARHALQAAEELGLQTNLIQIETLSDQSDAQAGQPGEKISGGQVRYRGRAAAKLAGQVYGHPWQSFTQCPYENLLDPGRLHLDPLGWLHLCQGLVIGNLFEEKLSAILQRFERQKDPLIQALLSGGPVELAQKLSFVPQERYADACHLCYSVRAARREVYPQILAPAQMYGIEA